MLESDNKKLKVTFGGYSAAGVKEQNEDAFSALSPKGQVRQLKGVVACLADGASCSENAQQASQMAVAQFIDDYFATPDSWLVRTAASKILSSLNAWLFHHGQQVSISKQNSFVTTFSSLIIKSNTVHLFHVGDSRIYRYRPQQRLELMTRDHIQLSGGRSLLTRALGMDSHLEIDYQHEDLERDDIFILSSDGVHEFVSPAEIRQAIETGDELELTAKNIVEHALASGSDDNVTCLIVRVDELPVSTLDEVHRQLTRLVIPPVMDIGAKIDGYEVKRVLHSGTRSHVYLVQHPDHNQPYVLKAPSPNFTDDAHYLEGFIREQWIGLRVDHASIMKVYPPTRDSRFLYLLAEYIEGQTLRQWMHDNSNVSLEKMREIVQGIVSGLRVLQRMEMIHRDLKPENVMLCNDGKIKLIDFGTVKVSGLSEITSPLKEEIPVGSVNYIAPEYLLQGLASQRSDLFSLGVMVYEMLSGRLPYSMEHVHRRRPKGISSWQYCSILDHNKHIPEWVDLALKKACHPALAERYAAYSEFVEDLSQPNMSLLNQSKRAPFIERNPIFFWKLSSLFLLLVVVFQWWLLME